ncbi:hypothetical protein POVCU2_0011500 [Plasmodium ovale curtisi]|uniref:Uncharacterized protein n=1 Tax=Plasmodium ovale curtisi TaxID=864141 RepID=A0A1A8VM48_PLAOA|nr:hypothetical protein POVCU2_0011500 [Plasmodium ovale curtisi]
MCACPCFFPSCIEVYRIELTFVGYSPSTFPFLSSPTQSHPTPSDFTERVRPIMPSGQRQGGKTGVKSERSERIERSEKE